MNENLIKATLQSVEEKLKRMEYGKVIIHKYGENKVDVEEQKRDRIEVDEKGYHKG